MDGTSNEERPPKGPINSLGSHHTTPADDHSTGSARQARCRRAASWRIVGGDPWRYGSPTAGYEAAADHLLELGLTLAPNRDGLRLMWKRSRHHRRAAARIAVAWELSG
jgi:hypothetical protein